MNIPNLVGGMYNTPYFFTYLISARAINNGIRTQFAAKLEGVALSVIANVESTAYPTGPAPVVAWGSLTSQGRYAEPVLFAWRLQSDTTIKDR